MNHNKNNINMVKNITNEQTYINVDIAIQAQSTNCMKVIAQWLKKMKMKFKKINQHNII